MRRLASILVVAVLVGASPARAATALDEARSRLASARAQLVAIDGQREAAQSELDSLAEQIAGMKSKRRPPDALDTSLRRSQELSSQLHALSGSRSAAEGELTQARLALFNALDAEVRRARDEAIAAREPALRRRALDRYRVAREERESLRAQLPSSQVPPLSADPSSDDPEELLEQADALRDAEDKVNRRLQAVRARAVELRRERELDRRMGDFLGDEALFDEQDRRLSLQRGSDGQVRVAAPTGGDTLGGFEMEAGDPAPPPAPADPGAPMPTETAAPPPLRAPGPSPIATDARPQVGATRSLSGALADDVEALEREEKVLEQQAASLADQARQIEERAKKLE